MCYKRRAPGLPADSFGETACRAAFSSVFSTAAAAFRRASQGRTGLCRRRPPGHAPTAGNARPRAIRATSRTAPGPIAARHLKSPERIEQLLLQHENATTETPRTTPAEARFLANEKARFGVRELTGGVLVSELRRGQGNGIGAATQVHVRYRGLLCRRSSVRPERKRRVVRPGQCDRGMAHSVASDACRRALASGDSFDASLWPRRRWRPDPARRSAGLRDRPAGRPLNAKTALSRMETRRFVTTRR